MSARGRQLVFSEAELLSNHDYAAPHVVEGQRLHGGFDAQGRYVSPRSYGRRTAIDNWTAALRERGGDLLAADASLLTGPRVPNVAQQRLLIENGVSRPFWNGLTITGKIEGRGRMIAQMPFPDLQPILVEDIGGMALGHLKKGLLEAHGVDEGGEPDKGIGGHDVMWFVARDLAFGPDAHPDVEPPGGIARPEEGTRWMPEVDVPYEMSLSFLMNLLLIEFRAEIGFAAAQATFRAPTLFPERAAASRGGSRNRRADSHRRTDPRGVAAPLHRRTALAYDQDDRRRHVAGQPLGGSLLARTPAMGDGGSATPDRGTPVPGAAHGNPR